MDLNKFTKKDAKLSSIMEQAAYWRRLERQVKQKLPSNLKDHYQVVCIKQGSLVIYTENAMVASRLKMIAPALLSSLNELDSSITKIKVQVKPQNPVLPKQKHIKLSQVAQQTLQEAATQLEHHPELSEALARFGQIKR